MSQTPDRLYELLPAIQRLRDAERGYPLRDLLRVIAEQVNAVEDDITRMYDDWFIETARDWVVPYIADLIGYEPVHAAGDPAASAADENRILIPRVEVANTIALRRRKGTLAVLELLANDVAGWPARAVEFFRLLGWTQNLDHLHMDGYRARTADLHKAEALDRIGTPFDPFARTADVRRITARTPGRYNIPSVGVFVWRLKAYSVTRTPAFCLDAGKNAYTFSVLSNDIPLFIKPAEEPDATHIAGELNVPATIRRRAFDADKDSYYGAGRSFTIWADWAGHTLREPIPSSALIAADLTDWRYAPPDNFIAVDPQLGRIAFPMNQLPERHVRVSYHYGFSADMGGGEYERTLTQPATFELYSVGERGTFRRIGEALAEWRQAKPQHAVIEIGDSGIYTEPIDITLGEDQSLQLRAANRTRPVIRLLDWQSELPDALTVRMSAGSRFTLDGLLVTGRGVSVTTSKAVAGRARAPVNRYENPRNEVCPAEVAIRHCTLVPGWTISGDCTPASPNKESLELRNVRAKVTISHSILGPIELQEDEVNTDPIPVEISDSIVDAMDGDREAIIGPSGRSAHGLFTVRRSTVFGIVQVHAIELAENSIFNDCVHVARRQIGCMRFCYVPDGCRTPKRYHCQPDLVMQAARERLAGQGHDVIAAAQRRDAERVRPQFTARHYGTPAYGQLAASGADEIARGADDGAEMGAFHDLFQPQRLANLRARLGEFTPAGMDAGILLAN
jgi:hypothetical protein